MEITYAMPEYLDSGVFLSFGDGGFAHAEGILIEYLRAKRVSGVDEESVKTALSKGRGRIAPPQGEHRLPDAFTVIADGDGMRACIAYEPGEGAVHTPTDALDALGAVGVVAGVDRDALEGMCAARQSGLFVAARGTPPTSGADGALELCFNTEHDAAPAQLENGRVDFYRLNLYTPVTEGQVLAVRRAPERGVPGVNVWGQVLPAGDGREAALCGGANTRASADGLSLIAARSGRVDLIEGVIAVSGVYELAGNVDMNTGNIDFQGDVLVRGNVTSGMTVAASGNIEVHGVVEVAELIAGGDIVLHRGIQGADKGTLRAGGDITAAFIERARVFCGRTVTTDSLLHSTVEADDTIAAQGRRGVIIGGVLRAGHAVSAQTVGNPSHTLTVIEVGVLPGQRERIRFLESEQKRLAAESARVSMIARSFAGMPPEEDTPERAEMRAKVTATMRQNALSAAAARVELEKLNQAMQTALKGRIHVDGDCHGGVRLSIGSISMYLDERVSHCTIGADGDVLCIIPFEV